MTIYLIIDMVKGFTEAKTTDGECLLYVPKAKNIVPYINNYIMNRKPGDYVFYIRDMHCTDDTELNKFPKHCMIKTHQVSFDDDLRSVWDDFHILNKNTIDPFLDTDLEERMYNLNDKDVVIMGCATEMCVGVAAIGSSIRGYNVTIPRSCIAAFNEEDGEKMLTILNHSFGVKIGD